MASAASSGNRAPRGAIEAATASSQRQRPRWLECARCGNPITVKARGRTPKWCSETCQHRAWEQSRAAASGQAAVQVVERVVTVKRTVKVPDERLPAATSGRSSSPRSPGRSRTGGFTTATCALSPRPPSRRGVSVDAVIAELADQLPTDTATVTRRRHLSFAGTIDAEEDFAERSAEILADIIRGNAAH